MIRGVPAGWVTTDEGYGGSPALRGWLETRGMPYVLAVKSTEPLLPPSGPPASAARLAERVPPERWLLLRRSQTTGELTYYVCAGPASLPLVALVWVAGARWRVEEAFQASKGLCGLDQHQSAAGAPGTGG
jgi:SRSO17 transposase